MGPSKDEKESRSTKQRRLKCHDQGDDRNEGGTCLLYKGCTQGKWTKDLIPKQTHLSFSKYEKNGYFQLYHYHEFCGEPIEFCKVSYSSSPQYTLRFEFIFLIFMRVQVSFPFFLIFLLQCLGFYLRAFQVLSQLERQCRRVNQVELTSGARKEVECEGRTLYINAKTVQTLLEGKALSKKGRSPHNLNPYYKPNHSTSSQEMYKEIRRVFSHGITSSIVQVLHGTI